MNGIFLSLSSSLLATMLVGCSSSPTNDAPATDGGTDANADAGLTIDQACTDSAHARCTKIGTCSAARLSQLYGDEATCETRLKAMCVAALNAPGNGNNAAATEACVTAVGDWGCGDFLISANPPAACAQRLGPGATGAPCVAAGQCLSGYCAYSSSACGTCEPTPTPGQPCSPSRQCGAGLSCSGNTTCMTPATVGAACAPTQPCAPALLCVTSVCTAVDSTVAVGQPCGSVGGKTVVCTSGVCTKGTCVAYAADGAACDETNGPYCTPGAFCVGGACRLPSCP